MMGFAILLIAIGGAFAIEGAFYAVVPAAMRRLYQQIFEGDDRMLHLSGLASVAIGVGLIMLGAKLIG